jgi:hypothetical protein
MSDLFPGRKMLPERTMPHRIRCSACDIQLPKGDKAHDPYSFPIIFLPNSVEYDPKKHSPALCVDCLLAQREEWDAAEKARAEEALYAAMEKEHFGVLSEETIKEEVEAGRLSAAQGLYEFMALMGTSLADRPTRTVTLKGVRA